MSVIVWDGHTLAADKQSTGSSKIRTTKIFKHSDGLYGFSGTTCYIPPLIDWIKAGKIAADYPKWQTSKDDGCVILWITNNKGIYRFDAVAEPFLIENEQYAIGSGSQFALGAMWAGSNAVSAVHAACEFNEYCGMGVDTLTLD